MPRRNPTERFWRPGSNGTRTIQVIERGDPAEDRAGVPFGFSRALLDEPELRRQQIDGWDEHAEIVGGGSKC